MMNIIQKGKLKESELIPPMGAEVSTVIRGEKEERRLTGCDLPGLSSHVLYRVEHVVRKATEIVTHP